MRGTFSTVSSPHVPMQKLRGKQNKTVTFGSEHSCSHVKKALGARKGILCHIVHIHARHKTNRLRSVCHSKIGNMPNQPGRTLWGSVVIGIKFDGNLKAIKLRFRKNLYGPGKSSNSTVGGMIKANVCIL